MVSGRLNQRHRRAKERGVADHFVPMVQARGEHALAAQHRKHGTQDHGHPEQGGEAATEADAAERGEQDEDC
ncbi:hypothetical protein ACQR2B_10430 [Bradyrhizobium oligotrophicum]|uniref:hypothetical protein n=1 Tax=Bradyrhizobium TaxID=374 RepID=UPI003EBB994B